MPLRRNGLLGVQKNEASLEEGNGKPILNRILRIKLYSYSKDGKECKTGYRPSYVLLLKKVNKK